MKYQAIDIEYLKNLNELKQIKKELNWLYKGLQYGFLSIFIIILVVYGLSGNIALAQPSDIEYTWSENVLYDDVLIPSESDFNRVYPSAYEGFYNATFSFTNDTVGLTPSNWTVRQTGGSVLVIERKTNHSRVLELSDIGSNYVYAKRDFLNTQPNGSIEFYIYTTDVTKSTQIKFRGGFDVCIDMDIDNSYFRYFTGTYHNIVSAVSNTWYHVNISYECSAGGYAGLLQYDWHIRINGVKYGDYNFFQNALYIDEFFVGTLNPDSNYQTYLDAVGFYPNDAYYNLGDNLIQLTTLLDNVSVPFEYTIASGIEQNDISNAYELDGVEWQITAQDLGGVFAVDLDLDLFTHNIYSIPELKISYSIRVTQTTGDDLNLNVETLGIWNTTTGLSLYGINETIGSFTDHAIDAVGISNLQFGGSAFDMYIDVIRFEYALLTDKCEFAFNSTGNLNNIGDDDVNGWTDIENVYAYPDVVNCYYSDDSLDRSIRIYSNGDGWSGIEKQFDNNTGTYYKVDWQFDVNSWGRGGTYNSKNDVIIYSYDQTEIFHLRIEGYHHPDSSPTSWIGDVYYYDGVDYIFLRGDLFPVDNMDFSLNWIHNDYENFTFILEGVEYSIPSLDNSKTGLGKIEIKSIINDPISVWQFIDYEIDYVAVYIDGIPYNDEGYTLQLFYYLGVDSWNMNSYNFIEFDFDPLYSNNISIVVNDAFEIIEYEETLYQLEYWKNLHGSGNYPFPYLEIFNGTGTLGFGLLNIKIYGIKLVDSLTSSEYIPTFTFASVDIQESYFYVDNNRLEYSLTTDDINTEYIQIDLDIDDTVARNRSFYFWHRKYNPSLLSECKIIYSDSTFSFFETETSEIYINSILPQAKVVDSFSFLITDNDNDFEGTITGYFSNLKLLYYPNVQTILPILNFLAIIPILVILLVIPIYIYIRFKKTWIFLPTVVLFAIIGTGSGVVPLWLTVVIIFSIVSYYIISRKVNG